ncbi:MAG: hypothetical protein COY82_01850 [Parcubacteria group bacterium CG_4_10_14_0_8_um_filter_35_7]|nr:MAG: hypothetical protein COX43_01470 [Parcubacteria group bacterium CG23_combo_of_CG06-09_8_20_14_all_35_9]PIY78560.1 MAG: hypothetical protein COY82_01850 [Parcubacteria group bacterium CG_4_10_14_0_8_um_filter_35_7]
MKEKCYLFTLHRSEKEFKIISAILSRNPQEATSFFGGIFIPREGGICEVSTDPNELGICGTVKFVPEIFRELDETDRMLAGLCLKGNDVVYTRDGIALLSRRGETVELTLRKQNVFVPEFLI